MQSYAWLRHRKATTLRISANARPTHCPNTLWSIPWPSSFPPPCHPLFQVCRSDHFFLSCLVWLGLCARVRILPYGVHHFLHSLFDFTHLRMDFLDQLVLGLGEGFNPAALGLELGQQGILPRGNAMHPPEADAPADHV